MHFAFPLEFVKLTLTSRVYSQAMLMSIPHKHSKKIDVSLKIGRYTLPFGNVETQKPKSELTLDNDELNSLISYITSKFTISVALLRMLFIFCTQSIISVDLSSSVIFSFSAKSFTSREKRFCACCSISARYELSLPLSLLLYAACFSPSQK